MLQRHLYSHGFSPPLIGLLIVVLLDSVLQTSVYAKQEKCHQLGGVKKGVTLTVKDSKIKKLLGPAKSLADCVALSCKASGANYAVLENGKCHALQCKKDACQIVKDAKSKQKIVGLARRGKTKVKHAKKSKSSKKQNSSKILVTNSSAETQLRRVAPTTNSSNWTLAFSTVVVPSNKTNPLLRSDNTLYSKEQKLVKLKKSTKNSKSTVTIPNGKRKSTNKKAKLVNKSKMHQKLHKKHSERRKSSNSKNKISQTNLDRNSVNNSTKRQTRDYPYSYYQYQYPPSEKSYQTQETDWRRDGIPSVQPYAGYDSMDRQPVYVSQDDLASVSEQRNDNGVEDDSNGVFSLPIASLVRRTEIPEGPHHISAISIVNDMLPDNSAKNYLTDRDSIPLLPTDPSQGTALAVSDVGSVRDSSERVGANLYGLNAVPTQYPAAQQALNSVQQALNSASDFTSNGYVSSNSLPQRNLAMLAGQPSVTEKSYGNYIANASGIPLSRYASLSPVLTGNNEDQSPTAAPVVIGSDQRQSTSFPTNLPQEPPANDVNNTTESSMDDLTDPVHSPNSPEGMKANMKKLGNISALANVLPSKEVPSVGDLSAVTSQAPSSVFIAPPETVFMPKEIPFASPIAVNSNAEMKSPVNALFSALSIAPALSASTTTVPPATIFPAASESGSASQITNGPLSSPASKSPLNDIDAPVQNAILPVGNKKEAYTESQSGDGQPPSGLNLPEKGKLVPGNSMDLPFPARLKLPEPSQSFGQLLSGLSTAFYNSQSHESVSPLLEPTILPAALTPKTVTTQLTDLPILTTRPELPTQAETYTTSRSVTVSNADVDIKTTGEFDVNEAVVTDVILPFPEIGMTNYNSFGPSPSMLIAHQDDFTVVPPTAVTTKDELPSTNDTAVLDSTSDLTNATNGVSDMTSYNETVYSYSNQTYEVTSDSYDSQNADQSFSPTNSSSPNHDNPSYLANSTPQPTTNTLPPTTPMPNITDTEKSKTASGHISPGTRLTPDTVQHISPISKPKLKIPTSGNVITLNDNYHTTARPGLKKIYEQYQLEAKNKAKLNKQRLQMFTEGNGCNEPLGMSNGLIRDDQVTSSSYLSPQYAPAKGRLGLQSGGANGWCADPRLNNISQYLQVDFRNIQDVCRVAIQGHHTLRNWITHYKVAFSLDGRRWSIYKEAGKEKVLQGNIEQDDWTSYRLIMPIRTRFVRILPQAWEGNAICSRVEFYTENPPGGEVLYHRSNIPNAMQNLINDLSFEKVDNEVVFDSSPMGNNAYLNKGASVYDTHGKCRHAARIIEGSDILLDGRNMRVKPREAISVSVWIRVDKTDGVHSIFDTVGANSKHVLGQYHFEIVGGAVRWFHRDENGTQIFSTITEPNYIAPREWTHLVASYDSETGESKIYVNGSRVAESRGRGLLSQDWGGRVGLGRHKDTRDLMGDIDEFRIYNEAIQGEKILELSRECDFDKYYCGSMLNAERGMLITPDYPSLHHGPVECIWEIKGIPGEVIALDVKEFSINNCNASKLEAWDRENDTLIGSYCGGAKPGRIESHGSQMVVKFTSTGSLEGERFKVEFHRERKRASKKTMYSVCRNSDLYQNVTLVGGSKAGTFTDLGKTNDMRACQERCCDKETCEIAFMIDGSCYGVRCYDQDLCKIRKAKNSKLNPMLSFITRVGMTPRVVPIFSEKPGSKSSSSAQKAPAQKNETKPNISSNKEAPQPRPQKENRKCHQSDIHYNVTLVRGMKSGNFTSRGIVENFDACFDKCCQDGNCDAAFMVKRTCFGIKCYDAESCKFKAARPSAFSPTLAYVIKEPTKSKPAVATTGTSKSAVIESNSCTKSRVSKVYRNVTLRDGINSGEFTDRGSVGSMDNCVKLCCGDDNCNLAFVIKDTCFTVKCKNYDACSLKAAVSHYYNPRIAYINWSPPKDNLGEGNNRYNYKGCWRDFDMSAFAIPLLEGTDPLLTGAYKKRDDPVNDCATVSQHRGYSVFAIQNGGACFSGPKAVDTYKRYGPSEACKGGRGGAFANSVYKLFDDGSVMSLGCWADLQDRAFRRMEKIDESLQDRFDNRADPIGTCATVARRHSSNLFALQKGGQCFIGKTNPDAYKRYGPSRKCKYGLGGQMANDVYVLRDDALVNPAASNPETVKAVLKNTTVDENTVKANPITATTQQPTTTQQMTTTAAPTTTATTPTTTTTTTATTTPKPTTAITATTTSTTAQTTTVGITTTVAANTEAMSGATSQSTASASANVKSGDTSKTASLKLEPGEVVYKEELTDTEHIKFIYSAGAVIPNVTLAAGINSGAFTDKGSIESMDDCVKSCGQTSSCDLAFKLGKQCFGVSCYKPDSCKTKPAFSAFYNPLIAMVKHRTIKTQRRQEEAQLDSNPTQRSLCKAKNTVQNVTLVDGIGAGNFTDLGHVSDMGDCVSRCCSDSKCELAFRIEDDCYGVTCYSEHSCRTRSARNAMSLRPAIAFVRDVGSRQVLTQEKPANTGDKKTAKAKPKANCGPDVWEGERKENMTLVGGINAGEFTDHGQTDTFEECMGYCCDSKECDLAFMIDKDCYGVQCKDPSMCKTRPARPTKYKPIIAFKKSAETGTTPGFSSTLVKSTSAATPTFGDPSSKHSCEAGSIAYNATLKMGMHSGLFTKLGRVAKMDDCIERCCRSSNADVAFMLGSVCFAVKCYSPELCKIAPAMISNIGNLNMNPTLSFLKKKDSTMNTGNGITEASKEVCSDSPITYNVTLKGGIHAGNFTNQGEGLTPRECVGKCCEQKSCDLAFMFADLCYSVECKTEEDCQAVVAKPSSLDPKVSFVTRHKMAYDGGTMFDMSTTVNEDETSVCDEAKLKHSPIVSNRTLAGGLNAGNFTYLGKTRDMKQCLGKCCGSNKCDVAYRIDKDCFSVKCYSPDLCKVSDVPAKNGFVQIATLSPADNHKLNTRSIAVYVMLGCVLFTVMISGIGMALCTWLKRKKMRSQHQQTEGTPMPDR